MLSQAVVSCTILCLLHEFKGYRNHWRAAQTFTLLRTGFRYRRREYEGQLLPTLAHHLRVISAALTDHYFRLPLRRCFPALSHGGKAALHHGLTPSTFDNIGDFAPFSAMREAPSMAEIATSGRQTGNKPPTSD